jgi:hypothetical protein
MSVGYPIPILALPLKAREWTSVVRAALLLHRLKERTSVLRTAFLPFQGGGWEGDGEGSRTRSANGDSR